MASRFAWSRMLGLGRTKGGRETKSQKNSKDKNKLPTNASRLISIVEPRSLTGGVSKGVRHDRQFDMQAAQ
ncbi:hypothetical protein I7I50_05193 [Histoplasma capsulatum G186AR]|uniref:Uncharacterized protein n=1 Tax=Ajellomyces capsulatus TaxID=5037 RepID=A0A8H7Z6C6_AJECA|nr:hypothetical protein I7I52_03451 [Histoplasma capsulatum]QSS75903.1 hypothetical protein I7I50_05193 [Histoplasma capsulatum G186AR]